MSATRTGLLPRGASRSRTVSGPRRPDLRRAVEAYRGCYLFACHGVVKVWDDREGTAYGPRWVRGGADLECARASVDGLLTAEAALRAAFPGREER